ncbi:hypothetical protein ACH9EU_06225 [Kocuria sp. M1R5S2]|uniref:hypothetical protein n=1 Tax=Kocuria rhizosphaerae TaxID=3376285 RepID=UPI0037A856BC
MDQDAQPPAEQDPFVVNRVPDDELDVSVPFELEASEWEWESHGSAGGTGQGRGPDGDHGDV